MSGRLGVDLDRIRGLSFLSADHDSIGPAFGRLGSTGHTTGI